MAASLGTRFIVYILILILILISYIFLCIYMKTILRAKARKKQITFIVLQINSFINVLIGNMYSMYYVLNNSMLHVY